MRSRAQTIAIILSRYKKKIGKRNNTFASETGVPPDEIRKIPPVSWDQPSTNAFAKGKTESEMTLDWLTRYKVPKVGDKYVMYHATPASNTFTTLKPGSFLTEDAETAKHQAGRDRGLKAGKIAVYEVHFYPWELGHLTTWAVTRSPLPLQKITKRKSK